MVETRLVNVLARLRARCRLVALSTGLVWGCFAAASALLLACWLDLAVELSPVVRLTAVVLAGIAGTAALAAIAWLFLAPSQPASIARRLDSLAATGGQVAAGLDLAALRLESLVSPQPALSLGLAQVAVRRAEALASSVPGSQAIPAAPVLQAAAASLLLVGTLGGIALLAPGFVWTQWLRFSDPYGDHPPYSLVVLRVEPGSTNVRYGDGLDVFVTPEGRRPIDAVELVLQPRSAAASDLTGEVLPMFQEPGGRWRAALAEVKDELRYFARARRVRSQKFSIAVRTLPEIEEVRFRATPPAYSGLPVLDGPLPDGGLAGLKDTRVEIRIRSNRPLQQATVTFIGREQSPREEQWLPVTEGAHEAAGTFTLDQPGRLEIQVIDQAGQTSRDMYTASLALMSDERPFVRLIEPRAVSFATPSTRLPIVMSAEDDFGVAGLELFRSHNDSRYLPLAIPLPPPPPRRTAQTVSLPLDRYGLAPGDEIKLFARVSDNDPAAGKGAESPVATVRIITEEAFERMLRSREGLNTLLAKYQEAQRRLEALAEEMERLEQKLAELPPDSPLAGPERGELDQLAERMAEEAQALRELAESPLPYDLDKELSKHLQPLAQRLTELAREAKSTAGARGATPGKAAAELARLKRELTGQRKEVEEQVGPPLELLAAIYPILEDEARFTQLYERQRDLAERLSALRSRDQEDDPAMKARARDLEAEQRRLQDELLTLLDDIDGHAKQLPQRPELESLRRSAELFASLVRNSEAPTAMSQAAAALAEFRGTPAADEARRAADLLESFLAKCEGMGEEGEACLKSGFQPSLSESLGNTLQQLLADSGLGSGGLGGGIGGGYSARRNSLANIGLYGGLPASSGSAQARARQASQGAAGANGYASSAQPTDDGVSSTSPGKQSAAGGEAAVPLQYRRKVGRYFQRLADELGSGAEQ
jgi:hypothetical protein